MKGCSIRHDRHLDLLLFGYRYRVVVSSSLVSVLYREALSHPYIVSVPF